MHQTQILNTLKSLNQTQIHQIINLFNTLVDQINQTNLKQYFIEANKYLNIKIYNLQKITISKIKVMYKSLALKFQTLKNQKIIWYQNQLRIFVWTMIIFRNILKKPLERFQLQDWQKLSKYFYNKTAEDCKFQYFCLLKYFERFNSWNKQQDEMLMSIIKLHQFSNKWNQIAKQLYIHSNNQYFKTGKQCRQRWYNYLDPIKIKGNWNLFQDIIIIRFVLNKGKKWSAIGKQLENRRTQNMVKTRYKSLISEGKKMNKKQEIQGDILKNIYRKKIEQINKQYGEKNNELMYKKEEVNDIYNGQICEVKVQKDMVKQQQIMDKNKQEKNGEEDNKQKKQINNSANQQSTLLNVQYKQQHILNQHYLYTPDSQNYQSYFYSLRNTINHSNQRQYQYH